MTRDEIYDHLAQVYLGKRKGNQKKKKHLNAWLVINIVITAIIFASIFYGLTAFFAQRGSSLSSHVIYSLHNGPLRISYNLNEPFPPIKAFSLAIPQMDLSRYNHLSFSIRAQGGPPGPGIMKILIKNQKNESAYYYVRGVDMNWQEVSVPLDKFDKITDWTSVTEVSFVLESWNVDTKEGSVLIDDISFAKKSTGKGL